jgi:hypothetical protein
VIARNVTRLPSQMRKRVEVGQRSHGYIDVVTKAFKGADSVFWLVPPDFRADSVGQWEKVLIGRMNAVVDD